MFRNSRLKAGLKTLNNLDYRVLSEMGEVRVKVKLTNAMDEALARRGKIKEEEIRNYEADALVDTSAVSSVIPAQVMGNLGLLSSGQRVAQ